MGIGRSLSAEQAGNPQVRSTKHQLRGLLWKWQALKTLNFLAMTLILLSIFTQPINAQQVQPINLQTVLEIGGANNLTIREFQERQNLASADLSKSREWWLPDFFAGISMHQLWGSAMNTDGEIFRDLNRQYFSGGIGLDVMWNFGKGVYKAKAANLNAQAFTYLTKAERNQALLESVEAYYNLLSAQLFYEAYFELANQADTIARQIAIQVEAGLRYQSELLLAKSHAGHLKIEMLNARNDYATNSAKLVNLLNLDPEVDLVITDSLLLPVTLISDEYATTPLDSAYQNRPEMKGMELMVESLEKEKKTTTTSFLFPQVRLGVYGNYFGDVFSPIDPTGEINGSVMWRIPIGRLAYGGELKQFNSRIALQQTKIAQFKGRVNQEVLGVRSLIKIAKEQLSVATESAELAQQALLQSTQRQELGTVRPFEIMQAQEIYIKAKLDYLKAASLFNTAQYRLFVALGNDL